jgi:hypothetical protein
VTLHLDPERAGDPFAAPPALVVLVGQPGRQPRVERVPLAWRGTDVLAATVPLAATDVAMVSLDAPGLARRTLAPVRLPVPPELLPVPVAEGQGELERLARLTGGRERRDPAGIWDAFPRRRRPVELAPWLLLLAAALLLAEVAERRLGSPRWLLAALRWQGWRQLRRRRGRAVPATDRTSAPASAGIAVPGDAQQAPVAASPGNEPPAGAPAPTAVAGALAEARRRSRERLRS